MITLLIFSLLLIVFTIMDIKSKAVPSILLTGTILLLTAVRFGNIYGAVLMGILGLLLWEFSDSNKVSFGLADIKVMIMLGFFISSLYSFLSFAIVFAILQFLYIFAVRKWTKSKEIPFLPLFLIIWTGGVMAGVFT